MTTFEELPPILRAVLGSSFVATHHNTVEPNQHNDNHESGRSRIVEGILFSRKFMLSYQIVLLVILLLFTIRHWTHFLRARTRQRDIKPHACRRLTHQKYLSDDFSRGSASSSSTVLGDPALPKGNIDKDVDERSPLLKPLNPPPKPGQISHQVRAFLIYQPQPIPLVNKTLPPNGTTLAILVFIGLQAFYVFYKMPLSVPLLFVFADRTSLLFVANLPWLYLFAAKNQPIKFLTGYSYESLNILHRRLGEILCVLALLHSVGMVGVWYTILRPVGFSLARFLLSKIILLGIGAFIAYELIYFTSLGSFRQRWYELFLALHVSLQVIALVLVWFHHHNSRPYVGAALAIFLLDRIFYRLALKVHCSRASLEVCQDDRTVIVRSRIALAQKWRILGYIFGAGVRKGWNATEHVFLTVPALSRQHIIQAHPFTIASKAPHEGDGSAEAKFIIRAQDGFSSDLLRYAKRHTSVEIRLDGPYGSQNALQLLQQCDLSVIVAGGSGIAVALPLAWALCSSPNVIDLEETAGKDYRSRIILIWITREESHARWADSTELQDLPNQHTRLEIIMPPPTATHGHPDVAEIVSSWISAHDDTFYAGKAKTGVVCSGPDGMNRAVRNTCSKLIAQGREVDVEVEKFGW